MQHQQQQRKRRRRWRRREDNNSAAVSARLDNMPSRFLLQCLLAVAAFAVVVVVVVGVASPPYPTGLGVGVDAGLIGPARRRRLQEDSSEQQQNGDDGGGDGVDEAVEEGGLEGTATTTTAAADYRNVYNKELQPCSTSGMARTGYPERTGMCVVTSSYYGGNTNLEDGDEDDDEDVDEYGVTSETICIDLTSLAVDDFCKVIGASPSSSYGGDDSDISSVEELIQEMNEGYDPWWWCSHQGEELPCHNDYDSGEDAAGGIEEESGEESNDEDEKCPLENWCVSPAALARYVQRAGCMAVGKIECESINFDALRAFERISSRRRGSGGSSGWTTDEDRQLYSDALNCLIDRCGLLVSADYIPSAVGNVWIDLAGFAAVSIGLAVGAIALTRHSGCDVEDGEDEDGPNGEELLAGDDCVLKSNGVVD